MKKYGSWTELASLVLRTPDNNAIVTIDAADDFPGPADTNYTFTIPNTASDTFALLNADQVFTTKTAEDLKLKKTGEAGTVTIRPTTAHTGDQILEVQMGAAETLNLSGSLTLGEDFTTGGSGTLTINPQQNSTVTLPNVASGEVVYKANGVQLDSMTMNDLRYTEQSIASAGSVASDGSTILHLTGSPVDLTDVTGVTQAGTIKVLENATSGALNILETGNIVTGTGGALTLEQNTSVTMYYTGSEWRIIGGSGSGAGGLKLQDLNFATWDAATPPNYVAAAGTHYLIDSAGGAMTIYLPSANQDGDVIRFSDASGSWAIGGSANLFIAPHSGGQLDGLAVDETLELDIPGSWIQFMWDEGQGKWVSDDPLSPSGLSWLSVEGLTGALTAETDKHYIATGNSPYTVTLPAGSDGFVFRISDSTQNFATNPITVTPNGAEQIDDYAPGESLVLDLKGVWVQFMWDGTQWLTDDPIAPSNIPSISGTTGGFLYSDGGDVANSETMFLNGSNVGIGTTSPLTKLMVQGDGSNGHFSLLSTQAGDYFTMEVETIANDDIKLHIGPKYSFDGSFTRKVITVDNNSGVGIGATEPGALLHLQSASTANLRLGRTGELSDGTDIAEIVFTYDVDGTVASRILSESASVNEDASRLIFSNNNGSGLAEVFRIDSENNVDFSPAGRVMGGISIQTPVNGNNTLSVPKNTIRLGGTATTADIQFISSTGITGGTDILVTNQTNGIVDILDGQGGVNQIITGTGGTVQILTNGAARFTYDSSSNVWRLTGGWRLT